MKYKVYPSIGIARLGNSNEFFFGPERLGSAGTESTGGGSETEVTRFKDSAFRFRRQAARFYVFVSEDDGTQERIFTPPAGARVRWRIRLGNKKDAILRPPGPPSTPVIPTPDPARQDRVIDTQIRAISGASAPVTTLTARYLTETVHLGEAWSDAEQRLIVLGGNGVSASPENAPLGNEGQPVPRDDAFYNNPGWYDDVSDGPVSAEIVLADGTLLEVEPAWLIVAPPDAARSSLPITSLHDVLFQVAIDQQWVAADTTTSFSRDIFPLLSRARSLRWSHVDRSNLEAGGAVRPEPNWETMSTDYPTLAGAGADAASIVRRSAERAKILRAESLLRVYRLRPFQVAHLNRWVSGSFVADWTGEPSIQAAVTGWGLTKSALSACAGQGFFPGIEGGRTLTHTQIYSLAFDFRLDHTRISPGDLTALMAQPWQADFLECAYNWWPSQRPDIAPQPGGSFELWHRPFDTDSGHRDMVNNVMRLGAIRVSTDGTGAQVGIEEGRDPSLV